LASVLCRSRSRHIKHNRPKSIGLTAKYKGYTAEQMGRALEALYADLP
jgi:hypothetical protein